MNYALIDAQGAILRVQAFDEQPLELAAAKALRWIPDNPPVVDPDLKTVSQVLPVPPGATEVGYLMVDVDIEILRQRKMAEIEAARNVAESADVVVLSRPWRAGPLQRALITQAITLANAGLPLPPVWIDADKSLMPITNIAQLLDIAGAMSLQVNAAYAHFSTLEAATTAAQTPEDLALIAW